MARRNRKTENIQGVKAKQASTKSAVKQYNFLIILLILLAMLILGSVYSSIIYNSASDQSLNQMNRAADAISNFYSEVPVRLEDMNHSEMSIYLNIAAETSGASIWVYTVTGRMIYYSNIPADALSALRIRSDGNIYLPRDIISLDIPEGGVNFTGGNLFGLFQESDSNWLTVIRPIYDNNGNFQANLMINQELSSLPDNARSLVSGFLAVLLVSIIVALLIITTFTRRIQEPIEKLTAAANNVTQGDLSARVDLTQLKENYTINTDDNDIMLLARTFNRMVDQLENLNSEQSDFIASISHDLRTPLTTIKGFVTAILDGTIPESRQEHYLSIVQKETERLTSLVSDMNDVIKLDNPDVEMEFKEFDINKLIMKTVEATEFLLEEKNITVQTNISKLGKRDIVYGDERQLERVIYNLITNAIKFVKPDEGVIAINTKMQGSDILIVTVEDNGPGIAPEKLPHIFDRFYKVDHSRTGNTGSGLGLYICRKILQQHGQQIFAGESESMGGAKFEFTLPHVG